MTTSMTQANTSAHEPIMRPPWTMPNAEWDVYYAAWVHARVHETALQDCRNKADAALAEYRAAASQVVTA